MANDELYQILLSNIYLNKNMFDYELLQKIGNKLVQFGDTESKIDESVDLITNCLQKYGFILYANDSISKYNGKVQDCGIFVSYHLSNFIFNTKSLLDSLAIMTKHFLSLNVNGSDIDLNKRFFLEQLIIKEPQLSDILQNKRKWIQTVVQWRNDLIHKKGITVIPIVVQGVEPSYEELGKMKVQMMVQTGGIKEFSDMIKNPLTKKPYYQEIEPFCNEWINNSRFLLELFLSVLCK